MRRIILSLVIFVFALVAFDAMAQDGTVPVSADTTTTAVPSTSVGTSPSTLQQGSGQLTPPGQVGGNMGDEVSRLQKEMEEKIRAIRTEYQVKIVEARKAVQASRQNIKQNVKQNVRQNVQQQRTQIQQGIKQNVRSQVEQNVRQNVRENVRQNIEGLLQQGGQPSPSAGSSQGSQGIQGQGPLGPQQNPIGPTQEQFGPPPSGQSGGLPGPGGGGSSGPSPSSGSSSGGSFTPPPSGGSVAPVPFSSSILQKFLPSYGW